MADTYFSKASDAPTKKQTVSCCDGELFNEVGHVLKRVYAATLDEPLPQPMIAEIEKHLPATVEPADRTPEARPPLRADK